MPHVIICRGFANGQPCDWEGQYLKWYNPEVPVNDVMAEWTDKFEDAKQYPTFQHAVSDWKRQRMFDGGLRLWDLQPDRPLTAFNIEILDTERIN